MFCWSELESRNLLAAPAPLLRGQVLDVLAAGRVGCKGCPTACPRIVGDSDTWSLSYISLALGAVAALWFFGAASLHIT